MATRAAKGFMDALQEAYGEGREDWSRAYRAGRTANNQSEDAPRLTEMTGAYPTGIRIMENLNTLIPKEVASRLKITPDTRFINQSREERGMGLSALDLAKARRTGQIGRNNAC